MSANRNRTWGATSVSSLVALLDERRDLGEDRDLIGVEFSAERRATTEGSERATNSSADSSRMYTPFIHSSLAVSNTAGFFDTSSRPNRSTISASETSSSSSPGDQPSSAR